MLLYSLAVADLVRRATVLLPEGSFYRAQAASCARSTRVHNKTKTIPWPSEDMFSDI